ncbi:MAG: hypothetical protein ACI3X7_00995 [Bacteroidaceae bacterium]
MRKKLLNLCLMVLLSICSTVAYALDKVDGVYQIGSAEDYAAFAEIVSGGETFACAVLTADIDLGTDLPEVGTDQNPFRGIFDGQGHTITINAFPEWESSEHGSAVFNRIQGNALIKNLKVQGTITTGQKYASGIAAKGRGTVRGCWVDVLVKSSKDGDATHAGVIGVPDEGALVEDCLVKFTIEGISTQNCGGIYGWCNGQETASNNLLINDGNFDLTNGGSATIGRNGGNLTSVPLEKYNEDPYANRPRGCNYNNYATMAWNDVQNGAVTIIDADLLKSGQICYQLNNDQTAIKWYQNIGEDEYPVPAAFAEGKKQVYASAATGCNGKSEEELTYSNEGTVAATPHTIDQFGVCTTCGKMLYEKLERDITDNSFIVNTIEDLIYLEGVNRSQNGGWFNISLNADLEYTSDEPGHIIFNNDNWYGGTLEGHGHSITINFVEAPQYAAFIPKSRATVRNLALHGAINAAPGVQYVGSVMGELVGSGATLENVYSDVDVNTNKAGDNTSAGVIGLSNADYKLQNVIYAGKVTAIEGGECIAGICGWSSGRGTYNNVAFIGDLVNAGGDSWTMSRNPTAVTPSNCYILSNISTTNGNANGGITEINPEEVASGGLAYKLNGNQDGVERFYQTIGTDDVPYPFTIGGHKLVYASPSDGFRCDGLPLGDVTYTNTPNSTTLPDHQYEDGFCVECGNLDVTYMTPAEDGWFEVSTPEQLIWWSHYAAKVDLGCSMRIMEDLDMEGYENYAIIGVETKPFYGSVDGQKHIISNLIINYPYNKGVGFIGVMNSVPDGASATEADRDATPAFIRNLVLDETCQVIADGYVGGILGMTASWPGAVEVSNCVVRCEVSAVSSANAGGIHGCCMGSSCRIIVDNCGVTSTVTGPTENGVISGWMGSYGKLTNCWSTSEVYEGGSLVSNFVRSTPTSSNNWWIKSQDGIVTNVFNLDIVDTGELAWRLNNSQFKTPVWYQRLPEDQIPYLDPERGVVAYLAEQYFSIYDEGSLAEAIVAVQEHYQALADTAVANANLREDLGSQLGLLEGCASTEELADAMDNLKEYIDAVKASEKAYKAYIDKCEEIKAYLDTDDSFEGELRDALVDYLNEENGPSAENPIGSYLYVIGNTDATDEQVAEETTRLAEWLKEAINTGYVPGTDITRLMVNPSFSGNFNGWEGTVGTGTGSAVVGDGETIWGGETWSNSPNMLDMSQTVKGLKPGLYLVELAGAYRPSNDRYTYNHIARVVANGNANFLQTVIEDPIMVEDEIDGVNCHTTGTTPDLAIYEDGSSTSGEEGIIGHVAHGPHGLAIAGNAGRYHNWIAAEVGEDSTLTIALKCEGSGYDHDWIGYSNVRLKYLGTPEDEEAAEVSTALASQLARANCILNQYEASISDGVEKNVAASPNFPQALKDALASAIEKAQAAATVEEKMSCISDISGIFQEIVVGKKAYINLFNKAIGIETIAGSLFENMSEDDYNNVIDVATVLMDAYFSGAYSTEEALSPSLLKEKPLCDIIAPQDENGTYQISTPMHLMGFGALVSGGTGNINAALAGDIDMTGYNFTPIGTTLEGTAVRYTGTFDGQAHAIRNLTIGTEEIPYGLECSALFNDIENGTVKNLKINSIITTSAKYAAGIAGRLRNAKVQNCDVRTVIYTSVEGDGTHGGIVGVNEVAGTVIENCYVQTSFIGESTNSCGGVIGWSSAKDNVKNCLVINDVKISTSGCNSISRNNDNCTASNTYFLGVMGDANIGTKIADETIMKTGELTWKLNGSQPDGAWTQALGVDTIPQLFGTDKVWLYAGEYTNDEPNIQLNAFAYNVGASTDEAEVAVSYTLNAEAEAVDIVFYNGEEVVATVPADGLTAGQHLVEIPNSAIAAAGTTVSYEVKVTGIGTKESRKVGDSYKVWSPFGLAVNNVPASAGFGQIYVVEADVDEGEGYDGGKYTGYISDSKHSALYAFTPDFKQVNSADGTPGFTGGLEIKDGLAPAMPSYMYDLKSVRVSNDGRLFIGRANGTTNSPIVEANPADLNADWTPVFTGGELDEATGITYVGDEEQSRMVVSFGTEGAGENLKLWVLGGQYSGGGFNFTDYACHTYNLGTASSWSAPASSVFEPLTGRYTIASGPVNIVPDQQGGVWYIQYRANPSEAQPALKHYNAEGEEDYSDIKTALPNAGMAVSADGLRIAFPTASGKVAVYETNYAPMANGKIWLEAIATVATKETNVTALAFDYAGNLYATSNASETFSRYTIPYADKVVVTPATRTIVIGTEDDPDAINSIEAEGENGSAIYNMAGQRVSKAQRGVFIQNGKKVAVK